MKPEFVEKVKAAVRACRDLEEEVFFLCEEDLTWEDADAARAAYPELYEAKRHIINAMALMGVEE